MAKNLKIDTAPTATGATSGQAFTELETASLKDRTHPTASPEEVKLRTQEYRTQGVKGCKAPRRCVCFSEENLQAVKIIAGMHDWTISQAIGHIIEDHRRDHPEFYEQALHLIQELQREEKS